jgi:hypothetical protein
MKPRGQTGIEMMGGTSGGSEIPFIPRREFHQGNF